MRSLLAHYTAKRFCLTIMELKLEIFSVSDWFSGFKGIEKGKKQMASSEGSSSKKGTKRLPMSCPRVEDCRDSSKGKAVLWGGRSEVEELNERLKILEEETEILKEALFWSMEERKNMMNEIYQHFRVLQFGCLQTRNHLVIGESSCVNPFEVM